MAPEYNSQVRETLRGHVPEEDLGTLVEELAAIPRLPLREVFSLSHGLDMAFKKYLKSAWARPAPPEELRERFYSTARVQMLTRDAASKGIDTTRMLTDFFKRYDCRFVPRDENGNFSIAKSQPYMHSHSLPTDGFFATPLDAYLRSQNVNGKSAGKINAILSRRIPRDLTITGPRGSGPRGDAPRRGIVTLASAVVYLKDATLEEVTKVGRFGKETARILLGIFEDPQVKADMHQLERRYLPQGSRLHKTEAAGS